MSVDTDSVKPVVGQELVHVQVEGFSENRIFYFSLNLGICTKICDALRTSEFGNPLTFPQVTLTLLKIGFVFVRKNS